MPISRPCRAKNPANCAYHGNQPKVEQFINSLTNQTPVDPAQVNLPAITRQAEVAAEAFARYGITNPDENTQKAWNRTFNLVGEDIPPTPEEYVNAHLNLDYGRHRGGPWLFLVAKDQSFWEGEKTPLDEKSAHLLDTGDYEVIAEVYTRNGGGNRECYCDRTSGDVHEEGCLAKINEDMAAHPSYLHDEDDENDSTYASFYFKVEDTSAFRASFPRAKDRENQVQQERKLQAIKEGRTAPWEVNGQNREHALILKALDQDHYQNASEYHKLPYEVRALLSDPRAEEKLAEMDAAAEALKAGDPKPIITLAQGHRGTRHGSPYSFRDQKHNEAFRNLQSTAATRKAEEDEERRRRLAEKEELLTAAYKDGRLPAELGDLNDLLGALRKQVGTPNPLWKKRAEAKQLILKDIRRVRNEYERAVALKQVVDATEQKLDTLKRLGFKHWPKPA